MEFELFFDNFFQGFNVVYLDSYFMNYLDFFQGFSYSLLFGVLIFVVFMFVFLLLNFNLEKSFNLEYQLGELFCSIIPTLILLFQIFPSLGLLYYFGLNNQDYYVSVKVVAHQWYWGYDYSDLGLEFDSYMKLNDSLVLGEERLLDVDNRCILPVNTSIRFCVTSADVIHAWSLSSMGIKLDAMSGILSVLNYNFPFLGVFYGQCSEICGSNHSFMPIVVEVTMMSNFIWWCLLMI